MTVVMNSVKVAISSVRRPRINRRYLKKPSPLPQRPLPVDTFKPPRGLKQVFLYETPHYLAVVHF